MRDTMTATPLPVSRLVTFADIAGGWNVVACAPEPDGGTTIVLCEATHFLQVAPVLGWTAEWAKADERVRYRLVHFGAGQSEPGLELVDGGSELYSAHRLPGRGWLVTFEREARVLADDGTERVRFEIGQAGNRQVTADGRLWCDYGDEDIFTSQPEDAGIACFEPNGRAAMHFNNRAERTDGVPAVWCGGGINIVSEDETWVSYYASWPIAVTTFRPSHAVARLRGYDVDEVWAWPARCDDADLEPAGPFALAGDRILVQGSGQSLGTLQGSRDPDEAHPHARLYLMPLGEGEGREFLPVDERGAWIGSFRAEGRGSRYYLATTSALFVADAAVIDA